MADNKLDKIRNMKADNVIESEKLDEATGGTKSETIRDSMFLNELMVGHEGQPKEIDYIHADKAHRQQVLDAWKVCGVKVIEGADDKKANEYYIDGKQVSRETAYIHAQKKIGRFLG